MDLALLPVEEQDLRLLFSLIVPHMEGAGKWEGGGKGCAGGIELHQATPADDLGHRVPSISADSEANQGALSSAGLPSSSQEEEARMKRDGGKKTKTAFSPQSGRQHAKKTVQP
ncbi:hypothetical protein GN956_G23265 [Arapaima gigas]